MTSWHHAQLRINKKKRILLMPELKQLDSEKITAGIHASDGQFTYENGAKLIDVALYNEYGTKKIPATHFITRIIQDINERRYLIDIIKVELKLVLKYDEKAKNAIRSIGSHIRDRIKRSIDDKIFLPNAESTIKRKGFDKRLFEKGFLYNSIKFRSKKARVEG